MRRALYALCLLLPAAAFTQNKYFADWPAGTDPREVGKRVAERFIPTPHMEMPSHGPLALHYSHVATWVGTLQFAAGLVTPNTFRFLGVPPALGRGIVDSDVAPGAPPVFVMSHKMWVAQSSMDPSVVGRVFGLNGVPTIYASGSLSSNRAIVRGASGSCLSRDFRY
jgi:hypothetical protein